MYSTQPPVALAAESMTWAAAHGLQVAGAEADTFTPAPLALLPTAYPREAFDAACALAEPLGRLFGSVAADGEWLRETLAGASEADPFTARLVKMNSEVQSPQRLALGILRSDYMLDAPTGGLLQIEYNTVASSFGGLSQLVGGWHRHAMTRHGGDPTLIAHVVSAPRLAAAASRTAAQDDTQDVGGGGKLPSVPENVTTAQLAASMATAHAHHGGGAEAVVLMVVQPGERNVMDQRHLEYLLYANHNVRTVRRSMAQVAAGASLGQGTGAFTLNVHTDHFCLLPATHLTCYSRLTTDYLILTTATHCLLLTIHAAHCQLPATYYRLPATYCLLLTACYILLTPHCPLPTACYLLPSTY